MSLKITPLDDSGRPKQVDGNNQIELKPDWVRNTKGIDTKAVDFAEYMGKHLAAIDINDKREREKTGMTTTQIRNFFGEVRKIQMKTVAKCGGDFAMLKPRMAIAKVRATKDNPNNSPNRIKDFEKAVILLVDQIERGTEREDQQFQNFADFIEAIVAYHKAYGGKN